MATQLVSGNRTFAQPGIDGGEFTVNATATNVLIIARTAKVETGWVQAVQSAGVSNTMGTLSNSPVFQRFNTLTSSGLFLVAAQVSAGQTYDWGTFGLGG